MAKRRWPIVRANRLSPNQNDGFHDSLSLCSCNGSHHIQSICGTQVIETNRSIASVCRSSATSERRRHVDHGSDGWRLSQPHGAARSPQQPHGAVPQLTGIPPEPTQSSPSADQPPPPASTASTTSTSTTPSPPPSSSPAAAAATAAATAATTTATAAITAAIEPRAPESAGSPATPAASAATNLDPGQQQQQPAAQWRLGIARFDVSSDGADS